MGETLTADTSGIADDDGLDSASFSYQWIRNDGTDDADIPGATDPAYMPSDEDAGKAIKVRVSFTDDAGNQESVTSAATAAVAATAPGVPQRLNVSPMTPERWTWIGKRPAATAARPSPATRCSGRRRRTVGTDRKTFPRKR